MLSSSLSCAVLMCLIYILRQFGRYVYYLILIQNCGIVFSRHIQYTLYKILQRQNIKYFIVQNENINLSIIHSLCIYMFLNKKTLKNIFLVKKSLTTPKDHGSSKRTETRCMENVSASRTQTNSALKTGTDNRGNLLFLKYNF